MILLQSFIGHLESIGSMSYAAVPNVEIFHYIIPNIKQSRFYCTWHGRIQWVVVMLGNIALICAKVPAVLVTTAFTPPAQISTKINHELMLLWKIPWLHGLLFKRSQGISHCSVDHTLRTAGIKQLRRSALESGIGGSTWRSATGWVHALGQVTSSLWASVA